MSIQAVSWVLEHSDTRLAERLVLLAVANHAGTSPVDGAWESWPGVELIAREARLAPRVVQDVLARLEATGTIERVVNGAPDDRIRGGRRPNLYRIITRPRGEGSLHPTPAPDPAGGVQANDTPPRPDGVQANDTPGPGWGAGSRQGGVKAPDAEGCREPSPKPSVEPSEEPPPSREPRGLTPDGDPPAGGEQQDQLPERLTADQRRQRIHEAVTILAERAADRAGGIGKRSAWVGAVAERLAGEHATAGHRLLAEHPDLPAQVLADLLADPAALEADDQRARQRAAEEATRRLIRETAAQPADQIRNAEHAARLRDQLRHPRPA